MPTSKREAQKQARKLRRQISNRTVNVKEIAPGHFGIRFSPKGRRDFYNLKKGIENSEQYERKTGKKLNFVW